MLLQLMLQLLSELLLLTLVLQHVSPALHL